MKHIGLIIVAMIFCASWSFGQQNEGCLGDISVKGNTENDYQEIGCLVSYDKKKGKLIPHFTKDKINLDKLKYIDSIPIHNCTDTIFSSYTHNIDTDSIAILKKIMEKTPVLKEFLGSANMNISNVKTIYSVVESGYQKRIRGKITTDDANKMIDNFGTNDKKHLDSRSKGDIRLITGITYIDSGYIRIISKDSVSVKLSGLVFNPKDKDVYRTIRYKPNKPAGYTITEANVISKKDLLYSIRNGKDGDPYYRISLWGHSFIPFGVRQFKMGYNWRGGIYAAGTGTGVITAAIAAYGYCSENCQISQTNNFSEKQIHRENRDLCKDIFWGGVGFAGLFYAVNVFDGLVFCKKAKEQKFSLNLNPQYNGINLTYNF